MKNLLLLITLGTLTLAAGAQVEVYKTYEDYQQKKPEMYKDYVSNDNYLSNSSQGAGASAITFLDMDGKKMQIKNGEIWGFMYKDVLFRFYTLTSAKPPVAVLKVGKLVYYENGIAYLDGLKRGKKVGYYSAYDGGAYFFSKDLSGTIYGTNKIDRFFTENLGVYDELLKCLTKNSREDFNDKEKNEKYAKQGLKSVLAQYLFGLQVKFVKECVTAFEGN